MKMVTLFTKMPRKLINYTKIELHIYFLFIILIQNVHFAINFNLKNLTLRVVKPILLFFVNTGFCILVNIVLIKVKSLICRVKKQDDFFKNLIILEKLLLS